MNPRAICVALMCAFMPFGQAANDTMIVKYKDIGLGFGVNGTDTTTTFPSAPRGSEVVADAPFLGLQVLRLLYTNVSVSEYCAELEMTDDEVQYCEPDSEVSLIEIEQHPSNSASPNDPLFKTQYNLPKIQATGLWQQKQFGNTAIGVCVPDTGTSPDAPDLQGSIKNGTSFMNGAQSNSFTDGNGHGTWVTGAIGAVTNNAIGIAGIVQNPSILACQFMDSAGNGALSDAALCFNWCLQQGANVISCSFGTTVFSAALQTAAQAVSGQNVFLATSAGNDGVDNDALPHYPSQLSASLPGVVAVAASDQSDNLWTRSDYGKTSVQIAAPGVAIPGLGLGGTYQTLSGTSMSSEPHPAFSTTSIHIISDNRQWQRRSYSSSSDQNTRARKRNERSVASSIETDSNSSACPFAEGESSSA